MQESIVVSTIGITDPHCGSQVGQLTLIPSGKGVQLQVRTHTLCVTTDLSQEQAESLRSSMPQTFPAVHPDKPRSEAPIPTGTDEINASVCGSNSAPPFQPTLHEYLREGRKTVDSLEFIRSTYSACPPELRVDVWKDAAIVVKPGGPDDTVAVELITMQMVDGKKSRLQVTGLGRAAAEKLVSAINLVLGG